MRLFLAVLLFLSCLRAVASTDLVFNWTPPTPATGIIGYNLYRIDGTVTTKVASFPVGVTGTLTNVASGYYTFHLKSVSAGGGESVPSNQTTALTSLPPPPIGLSVTVQVRVP